MKKKSRKGRPISAKALRLKARFAIAYIKQRERNNGKHNYSVGLIFSTAKTETEALGDGWQYLRTQQRDYIVCDMIATQLPGK